MSLLSQSLHLPGLTPKTNDTRHSQLHHHIPFPKRIQRILRVHRGIWIALSKFLRLTLARRWWRVADAAWSYHADQREMINARSS